MSLESCARWPIALGPRCLPDLAPYSDNLLARSHAELSSNLKASPAAATVQPLSGTPTATRLFPSFSQPAPPQASSTEVLEDTWPARVETPMHIPCFHLHGFMHAPTLKAQMLSMPFFGLCSMLTTRCCRRRRASSHFIPISSNPVLYQPGLC